MKIGVVSELTGGADICVPVDDVSQLAALAYVADGETVLFAFQSPKEEYAFTNEALVAVRGDSAVSTKRSVLRLEYQAEPVRNVRFETCGVTDRDCELKFTMGATRELSIDIAKAEQPAAQRYFRVLLSLSRRQQENARAWEFAKLALDASVRSTMTTSTSTTTDATTSLVVTQADAVHAWYLALFQQTNPRCYKDVLLAALTAAGSAVSTPLSPPQ